MAAEVTEQPMNALSPGDDAALKAAVGILEGRSFIGRLTEITGEPLTRIMKRFPKSVTAQIDRAVRSAMAQALEAALYKIGESRVPESPGLFRFASGVTGGVSGFFGLSALALELPVTTTLMLRSIARIAEQSGEDLSQPGARLACLEVFALGPHGEHGMTAETSYYAARTFLARTVSEATQNLLERGVARTSGTAILEFLTSVGSRFGVVVSEKVAAGAIPVVGAIGGAAINVAFMHHFQQIAKAHFLVRDLERRYGPELVSDRYRSYEALRNA